MRAEWQGNTYDLLARNCCHFCETFAAELGVGPIPGWLNRFATNADATIAFTSEAISTVSMGCMGWGGGQGLVGRMRAQKPPRSGCTAHCMQP